ncbi:Expansin-like [Melia azedarach]|uniref:Expansin-like n=1 Tax=Melia azedarach TaxID=155640 RepID=A0ACC1XWX0_MELAZ|nr:Expansin-like [Melia azedarach]
MAMFLRFLFFLFSFATASAVLCPRCEHEGKVSYFSKDSALSSGACAYGSLALDFNHGYVAAAASAIYTDGALCGGCYRMRCKNKTLCRSQGTTVIVTDQISNGNKTDFVLSRKAYMALAKKGMGKQLLRRGAVDIEYKRYPCDFFNNKNLSLRVQESRRNPDYVALEVLYQGGQTEIKIFWVARYDSTNLIPLRRNHSAVWDIYNIPDWPLRLQFEVLQESFSWHILAENFIPVDGWKPGRIYDTGVQTTEYIGWESCSVPKCPEDGW